MFAVEGWKLPNIVPQRPEKKRKFAATAVPSSSNGRAGGSGSTSSKSKKQKTTGKSVQPPPPSASSKKPGKDKSKYMPYSNKAGKGSSGANVVPVAKQRRTTSPLPPSSSLKAHYKDGKAKEQEGGKKRRVEKDEKKNERKPLARRRREERSATPERLLPDAPPPSFSGLQQQQSPQDKDASALTAAAGRALLLTPLQRKMAAKLSGARFRWINEKLYTTTGQDALALVAAQPGIFKEYHDGFKAQVRDWPSNPIDTFIARLEALITTTTTTVARNKGESQPGGAGAAGPTVVVDLGCGEGELGRRLRALDPKESRVRVLSYDLQSIDEKHIVACDIRTLPLQDKSVDIAVFCLSLMGTDFLAFLVEAFRVLKPGGHLWIAEIKSRFSAPDAKTFIQTLHGIGFAIEQKDDANKMFIMLDFTRGKDKRSTGAQAIEHLNTKKVGALLKPCIYKKR